METKRKALGKGLEQLFSNEVIDFENFEKKIVNETKDSDIVELPLTEIRSNPYQPRKEFDEKSLSEFEAAGRCPEYSPAWLPRPYPCNADPRTARVCRSY